MAEEKSEHSGTRPPYHSTPLTKLPQEREELFRQAVLDLAKFYLPIETGVEIVGVNLEWTTPAAGGFPGSMTINIHIHTWAIT